MESCPRRVLLVLGIAVALAATAWAAPQQEAVSYEEALSLAIDLCNQESETDFAFRLLEAKPQPEWDPLSQGVQELAFTVKETTCPVSKLLPGLEEEECDFKHNGLVKKCSGTLAVEQGAHAVRLDCDPAAEEHIRVRRGGFRKLKRKVKKTIKKVKKGIKKVKKGVKHIFLPRLGHIPQGPGGGLGG